VFSLKLAHLAQARGLRSRERPSLRWAPETKGGEFTPSKAHQIIKSNQQNQNRHIIYKSIKKILASLTWKELAKRLIYPNSEHHNSENNLLSWKKW